MVAGVFIARETPHQHDFRPVEIVRVLAVRRDGRRRRRLRSRVFSPRSRFGTAPVSPAGQFQVRGQPFEDRAHDVQGVDAVRSGLVLHHPPQLVGDQRVDNDGLTFARLVNHAVDLSSRADVGAADQADGRILKLNQAARTIRWAVSPVASETTKTVSMALARQRIGRSRRLCFSITPLRHGLRLIRYAKA